MADKKISALTASTTPLAGTEVLPIVQSGATVKVAVSDLTAGRAISATQATLTTGNLIVGTAGKGIDFSAASHAAGMTSELLADYEEGTFLPGLFGATTTTYTTQTGRYTKIGRHVFFQCELQINSLGDGNTSIAVLGDLPSISGSSVASVAFFTGLATSVVSIAGFIGAAGGNSVQFQSLTAAATNTIPNAIFQNGARIIFGGHYTT